MQVRLGDVERGHAGRGQPAEDERRQRVIVARAYTRDDGGALLAAVAVSAVAARAGVLEPAASGAGRLRTGLAGEEDADESDRRAPGHQFGYSRRATREAAPQLRPQAAAAMATGPAAPRTTATAPKFS